MAMAPVKVDTVALGPARTTIPDGRVLRDPGRAQKGRGRVEIDRAEIDHVAQEATVAMEALHRKRRKRPRCSVPPVLSVLERTAGVAKVDQEVQVVLIKTMDLGRSRWRKCSNTSARTGSS
jgi:hypothetical protein